MPAWTAIAFLMLGLFLIVIEVWMPGYFIAVPGGALFLGGALALGAPDLMFASPWAWLLWPLALGLATVANLYAYKRWAPPARAPLTMGTDSLPGEVGTVMNDVTPGHHGKGKIRIRGATWSARSDVPIPKGAQARVVRVEGVFVIVEPEP